MRIRSSIAVVVVGLLACAEAVLAMTSLQNRGIVSTGGSYFVEYVPRPDPIPLNEMFEVTVRVSEAADHDKLLDDAVVTAAAWMPDHNHGSAIEARSEHLANGTTRVTGLLFHMVGHWELRLGIARKGRMERATFDVFLE